MDEMTTPAVQEQTVNERYALYCGDSMELMQAMPDASIHLTLYSPPFATGSGGLYTYSSSERDLSNCSSYDEYFEHYTYFVREISRITLPGRMSVIHCMDTPRSNTGRGDSLMDFPGDIIRLHEKHGMAYVARYSVWKEPLTVRNRTMMKALAHKTIVDDSTKCSVASADYMLVFRNAGDNPEPVGHPYGLTEYAGARQVPPELLPYKGWTGKQTENRYSHWIWRQYASSFWDDVRLDRVLPYREARDEDDERHVHACQLDALERALILWSNPGDRVFSPFLGVGSDVYAAVANGRFGIGCDIKPSYYRQAIKNLAAVDEDRTEDPSLFDDEIPADLPDFDLDED